MVTQINRALKRAAYKLGFDVVRVAPPSVPGVVPEGLPDEPYYRPHFSPWLGNGYGEFRDYLEVAGPLTLISPDRLHVLYSLARQATQLGGHWYECGVYKGGSAALLAKLLAARRRDARSQLHHFNTFSGMPETDAARDWHRPGDFGDTSLDAVETVVRAVPAPDSVRFHPGLIPATFEGGSSAVSGR